MSRTTARNDQIREDVVTGGSLIDSIGIYDETNAYTIGEIVFWSVKVYKATANTVANVKGDVTNSPDLDTANWDCVVDFTENGIQVSSDGTFTNRTNISPGGLSLNQGDGNDPIILLESTDGTHSLTSGSILGSITNNTYGGIIKSHTTAFYGLAIVGITNSASTAAGVLISGHKAQSSTIGAIILNGSHHASNVTATLNTSSVLLDMQNNTSSKLRIYGDGSIELNDAGAKFSLSNNRFFDTFLYAVDSTSVSDNDLVTAGYLDARGYISSATGNDTEIQFNDNGSFGANSNFTYDDSTGVLKLNAANINISSDTTHPNSSNVSPGGICLEQGTNDTPIMLFSSSDVTTGLVSNSSLGNISTSTYGGITKSTDLYGGLSIIGISEGQSNATGLILTGYLINGSNVKGVVAINGASHNSSGTVNSLIDTDIILELMNNGSNRYRFSAGGSMITTNSGTFYNQGNISSGGIALNQNNDAVPIALFSGHGNINISSNTGYLGTVDNSTFGGVIRARLVDGGIAVIGRTEVGHSGVIIRGEITGTGTTGDSTAVIVLDGWSNNGTDNLISNSANILAVRNGSISRLLVDGGGAIHTSPDNDFANRANISSGGVSLGQSNSSPIAMFTNTNVSTVAGYNVGTKDDSTFGIISIYSATTGGLKIAGFTESTYRGLELQGAVTGSGHSTAGAVRIQGWSVSGTSNRIADGNVVLEVCNVESDVFRVMGDGDIYYDTAYAGTLDVEDDIELLEAMKFMHGKEVEYKEDNLDPNGVQIPKNFPNKKIKNSNILKLKSLGFISDSGLTSTGKMTALSLGTITQIYNIIKVLGDKLGYSEEDLKDIAMGINK